MAVCSSPFSASISTSSPTAMGFVDVMPSSLRMPLSRAFHTSPPAIFTTYQLPVDLYTFPFILWEFFKYRPAQQQFQHQQDGCGQRKRKKLLGIPTECRHFDPGPFQLV